MNKQRRKQIEEVIEPLSVLLEVINDIKDSEQEYLENMPENLQDSEKAGKAQTAIDALESAYDSLEEAINSLNESIE